LEDAEPFWMDKIDDMMAWRYMILKDTSGKVINLASKCSSTASHVSNCPRNIHAPVLHTTECTRIFPGHETHPNSYRRCLIIMRMCGQSIKIGKSDY
jgi:hypothetical protein